IDTSPKMEINVSQNLLKRTLTQTLKSKFFKKINFQIDHQKPFKKPKIEGVLIVKTNETPYLVEPEDVASELGLRRHKLNFSTNRSIPQSKNNNILQLITNSLNNYFNEIEILNNSININN